jgi:hypothetical protein
MKTLLLTTGAVLWTAAVVNANIIHSWDFSDPAGTLMTAAGNSGTVGGVNFAGANAAWTTDGVGSLSIGSASGDSLIQSNANMGPVNGTFSIQYDMGWNFGTAVMGNHREMFLISRTASGSNPSGNVFRFSMTVYSGQSSLFFAHVASGHTGMTSGDLNYRNPVTIANLEDTPAGSLSLKVTYTFNEANTMMNGIMAEYSLNGGASWMPYALDGTFAPFAVTDLGDLRLHAKGNFSETNYYRVDGITVTVVPEPATYAALLGLAALIGIAIRRKRVG